MLRGTSSGPSGNSIREIHQDKPGVHGSAEKDDKFGFSLTTGDFDGDGCKDLAIGSPTGAWLAKTMRQSGCVLQFW